MIDSIQKQNEAIEKLKTAMFEDFRKHAAPLEGLLSERAEIKNKISKLAERAALAGDKITALQKEADQLDCQDFSEIDIAAAEKVKSEVRAKEGQIQNLQEIREDISDRIPLLKKEVEAKNKEISVVFWECFRSALAAYQPKLNDYVFSIEAIFRAARAVNQEICAQKEIIDTRRLPLTVVHSRELKGFMDTFIPDDRRFN